MLTSDQWADFLARHDPVWERLPSAWTASAFLGDGRIGSMIYQDGPRGLRFDLGHGAAYDHRPVTEAQGILLCRYRHPIGYFTLNTCGEILGGRMRLDLWQAEARGTIETRAGRIAWRALVAADHGVLLAEARGEGGEVACSWEWHPQPAECPCLDIYSMRDHYTPNPPLFRADRDDGIAVSVQPLLAGGETATAWSGESAADGTQVLIAAASHSHPGAEARDAAAAAVAAARDAAPPRVIERHRAWWRAYYPLSFVSLTDTRWEAFYWIQMYKLGCALRPDGPMADTMGPWFQPTAWPAVWWNMNLQLTYWPVYASNRLALGESLCRTLDRNLENLIANAPPELRHDSAAVWVITAQDCRSDSTEDLHTLPWACHNYWLQYRYSMDESVLRRLFPLLRRAIQFIVHHLQPGEPGPDGRPVLHLRPSQRGEQDRVPDNTAALALLRWGCQALLESCARLGIDDPLAPRWREILETLAPYPASEEVGLLHHTRSFHPADYLLAIYPLHLLTRASGEDAQLLDRTLDFWFTHARDNRRACWLFAHGAAMMTCSGRHAEAAYLLQRALDIVIAPNTFYHEDRYPVIESPLAWAAALHELLLQSWGGVIRVFPGLPPECPDAVFEDLRAEGAFRVSARRSGGVTRFVRITSLAGEPCRVAPGLVGPVRALAPRAIPMAELGGGIYSVGLKAGESVVLRGQDGEDVTLEPVAAQPEKMNYYGLNARSGLA